MANNFKQMAVMAVRRAKVTHPTGDPSFSVMQAFPSAFKAQDSDPFLMCDAFGPSVSDGIEKNPDKFPVQWHPHRGMDILTYLTQGVGRHADSLGNRETFASPGMQWISVVSTLSLFAAASYQYI
jgi:redox-sensitive bicupin YhaK (pirin superfamily)